MPSDETTIGSLVNETSSLDEISVTSAIRSKDAMSALSICIQMKEKGHIEMAETYLWRLQASHPVEPAILYEIGVICRNRSPSTAEKCFLDALKIAPHFVSAFRALGMLYLATGDNFKFFSLIRNALLGDQKIASSAQDMLRLYNYIFSTRASASASASPYIDAINEGVQSSDVEDVFSKIISAIDSRKPFALVRLGDGEGALARFSDEEEIINQDQYRRNRNYFVLRWYGQSYDENFAVFDSMSDRISTHLHEVDVLAAPGRDWIMHEAINSNINTLICCINAARMARIKSIPSARTSIHYDLLDSGALSEIICSVDKLCIITSHRTAAALIEQRFGNIRRVELVVVPPAFSDLDVTGYKIDKRCHEVTGQVVSSVKQLYDGNLILVGAGIAGKLISIELKKLGYISLDIGSVFDMILGLNTRPNFRLYNPEQTFSSARKYKRPT